MASYLAAFQAALALVLAAACAFRVSARTMRLLILGVTAAILAVFPVVGIAEALAGRPPMNVWRLVLIMSVAGTPAGWILAVTVVPAVLLRRGRRSHVPEAIAAILVIAIGIVLSAWLV